MLKFPNTAEHLAKSKNSFKTKNNATNKKIFCTFCKIVLPLWATICAPPPPPPYRRFATAMQSSI